MICEVDPTQHLNTFAETNGIAEMPRRWSRLVTVDRYYGMKVNVYIDEFHLGQAGGTSIVPYTTSIAKAAASAATSVLGGNSNAAASAAIGAFGIPPSPLPSRLDCPRKGMLWASYAVTRIEALQSHYEAVRAFSGPKLCKIR